MFVALTETDKAVLDNLVCDQHATIDFINGMIVLRNFEPIKYIIYNHKNVFEAETHEAFDGLLQDIEQIEIEDAMYEKENAVVH